MSLRMPRAKCTCGFPFRYGGDEKGRDPRCVFHGVHARLREAQRQVADLARRELEGERRAGEARGMLLR